MKDIVVNKYVDDGWYEVHHNEMELVKEILLNYETRCKEIEAQPIITVVKYDYNVYEIVGHLMNYLGFERLFVDGKIAHELADKYKFKLVE